MKFLKTKTAILVVCCFTIFTVACKKNTSTDDTVTVEESVQARIQSDDASTFQGETENADDDVNNSMATSERFCGPGNIFAPGGFGLPDGTVSTTPGSTTITITYNGTLGGTCRKRTGSIVITLVSGNRWIDSGAVVKYSFVNFKVEDICRNRSITLNGDRYITNVHGGNVFRLKAGLVATLVHRVRTGNLGIEASFTDSSGTKTAVWNVARSTEIKYVAIKDAFYFSTKGDTTINSKANTESWGTTRFGLPYQTVFSNPVKGNTFCKLWRPTSGTMIHYVGNFTGEVNFGLNASGNPVGLNDCATHFRVTVNGPNGYTNTNLIAYK